MKLAGRLALVAAAALIQIGSCLGAAHANLALTPTGSSDGFTLSLFADQYPNAYSIGPLGIGFNSDGSVLTSDLYGTVTRLPSDTDGQHYGSGVLGQNYGWANAIDIAQVGSHIYMTEQANGQVVEINPNGTFNQLIVAGLPHATGMITDPVTGHLYVSTYDGGHIWDVNPLAKTFTVFNNDSADGLSMSADGKTLYAEVGGHILGFNTTTAAQVFDSGFINGADGTALGFGNLTGNIFVNTNYGDLYEVNLTTSAQTLIADNGSRGDFVTVDPTNNSLLVTQTDSIWRLTGPAGSGFGNAPVPEPAFYQMGGLLAMGALGFVRRRFKAA